MKLVYCLEEPLYLHSNLMWQLIYIFCRVGVLWLFGTANCLKLPFVYTNSFIFLINRQLLIPKSFNQYSSGANFCHIYTHYRGFRHIFEGFIEVHTVKGGSPPRFPPVWLLLTVYHALMTEETRSKVERLGPGFHFHSLARLDFGRLYGAWLRVALQFPLNIVSCNCYTCIQVCTVNGHNAY